MPWAQLQPNDNPARGVVTSAWWNANTYITAHTTKTNGFLTALSDVLKNYQPPQLDVTAWTPTRAPTVDQTPTAPTLPGNQMPVISFNTPGGMPGALPPNTYLPPALPDFDGTLQDFAPINVPGISVGAVPTVPSMSPVGAPDKPTYAIPDAPTMLPLLPPSKLTVDIHEDMLEDFKSIPLLSLVEPSPFDYTLPDNYSDAFLVALKTELTDRIVNGGTGLPAAVEQAIWDRARSRELAAAANDETEVTRLGESSGFPMPAGTVTFNILQARQKYNDKQSSLSRDIAIKQAELEQKNIEHAITEGVKLEATVIDHATKMVQIGFEAAKTAAQMGIEKYNADAKAYAALLEAYKVYAGSYEAIIKGELARVDAYKAEWQGIQATADANKATAAVYESQIKAALGFVEMYKAEVEAARSFVEMEKAKIDGAKAQIEGYIAGVNAQTAVLEGSKIQAQVQTAVTDAYKSEVQAYAARVDAVAKTAQVSATYAQIQLDAKKVEWDGWKARVEAEKARIAALSAQSASIVDGYKAVASISVARAEILTKQWESENKLYESVKNYSLNVAKVNADVLGQHQARMVDAAKAGAQVYAQLLASAYGMVNTSASVSDGFSASNSTNLAANTTENTNFNYAR